MCRTWPNLLGEGYQLSKWLCNFPQGFTEVPEWLPQWLSSPVSWEPKSQKDPSLEKRHQGSSFGVD